MAAHAVCLVVAGVLRAAIPASELTLEWQHSVQKTRWQEHYVVEADALRLDQARVQGSGAGMEAGENAVRSAGWWTWHPDRPLPELTLSASEFTTDHTLCIDGYCKPLHAWIGGDARSDHPPITLRPCPPPR
jgi:hypothetical protein